MNLTCHVNFYGKIHSRIFLLQELKFPLSFESMYIVNIIVIAIQNSIIDIEIQVFIAKVKRVLHYSHIWRLADLRCKNILNNFFLLLLQAVKRE